MSPKQEEIFAFVRRFYRERAEGPTTADVVAALADLSESAIRYNLKALVRADYLLLISDGGHKRWSPIGDRALDETHLWRAVDEGVISWSGGKPKYPRESKLELTEGPPLSEWIIESRR